MKRPKANVKINSETASAIADGLSYYLAASEQNYGAGWDSLHPWDAAAAQRQRRILSKVVDRMMRVSNELYEQERKERNETTDS